MSEGAGETAAQEVSGTLRWNEFEGRFWSLELAQDDAELGSIVVLNGWEPAAGMADGTALRARVVPRPELIDFTMAGLRVDVLDAQLLG